MSAIKFCAAIVLVVASTACAPEMVRQDGGDSGRADAGLPDAGLSGCPARTWPPGPRPCSAGAFDAGALAGIWKSRRSVIGEGDPGSDFLAISACGAELFSIRLAYGSASCLDYVRSNSIEGDLSVSDRRLVIRLDGGAPLYDCAFFKQDDVLVLNPFLRQGFDGGVVGRWTRDSDAGAELIVEPDGGCSMVSAGLTSQCRTNWVYANAAFSARLDYDGGCINVTSAGDGTGGIGALAQTPCSEVFFFVPGEGDLWSLVPPGSHPDGPYPWP
jgi:hypothetical protein